eukprot:scaffold146533_cov32-Tisochrysis_lutea.AAC.4
MGECLHLPRHALVAQVSVAKLAPAARTPREEGAILCCDKGMREASGQGAYSPSGECLYLPWQQLIARAIMACPLSATPRVKLAIARQRKGEGISCRDIHHPYSA